MTPRLAVALALAFLAAGCGTNLRMNRDWDDPADETAALEAQSPEGFVDRLGDPDEWRNEGKGDDLRMIAIWKCVDGRDREVVWRPRDGGNGVVRWVVLSDTLREADCP